MVCGWVTGYEWGYGLWTGLWVAQRNQHQTQRNHHQTQRNHNHITLFQRSFILNESFFHFNGLLSMYRRMAFNALSFRIIIS